MTDDNKTISVGTRIRPTTMANLARLLADKAKLPSNRADILRQSLEMLEQIAIAKAWIHPVDNVRESVSALRYLGINIMTTPASAERIAQLIDAEIQLPMFDEAEERKSDMMEIAKSLLKEIKQSEESND